MFVCRCVVGCAFVWCVFVTVDWGGIVPLGILVCLWGCMLLVTVAGFLCSPSVWTVV